MISLVIAVCFAAGGAYLVINYLDTIKKQKQELVERIVLRVAQVHGGIISITELAAASEMTISEAEEVLENFSRRGVAVRKLAGNGAAVYQFSTLLSAEEKKQAKSIYEL
ncbi:hypothetical protein SAMN05421736_12119 [Evansella caseinilytica]|uniref:Uncharacterized protein n=1 Tax=Evansella caseinilytica TaxID=1503961 RepID=A0A1H3UFQ4_9BACI|nr:hypothetical protein [Evansella caseinilytica]SDZ61254.1 hypothetical protein SAMN05421736_12119 [Evansella caseinilytica]